MYRHRMSALLLGRCGMKKAIVMYMVQCYRSGQWQTLTESTDCTSMYREWKRLRSTDKTREYRFSNRHIEVDVKPNALVSWWARVKDKRAEHLAERLYKEGFEYAMSEHYLAFKSIERLESKVSGQPWRPDHTRNFDEGIKAALKIIKTLHNNNNKVTT